MKSKKLIPKKALGIDINDKILAPNAANMNINMEPLRSTKNQLRTSINVMADTPTLGSHRSKGEKEYHTV